MKPFRLWLVFGIAALILLPFLYNVIATMPALDDVCYFTYIHHHMRVDGCVIAQSPPQWAHFSSIISFVAARYAGWSGRFTSDLLIASWLTAPINIITSYAAVLYALFVVYFLMLYLFFRTLLSSSFFAILSSLFVIIATFLLTPDIPQTEYWITSILTYRMAVLFGACFCAYLYSLFRSRTTTHRKPAIRILHYCTLAIGGVLLCGFNESFMLLVLFLTVVFLLAVCRSANRVLAIALAVGVAVGVLLVFASPGNNVRIATEQNVLTNNVFLTALVSFAATITYSALFCFLLLLLHPLRSFRTAMRRMRESTPSLFSASFSFPYLIVCAAYFFIPMAFILPLVWGLGGVGPLRTHGQILLTLFLYSPLFYNSLFVLYERRQFPAPLQRTMYFVSQALRNRTPLARLTRSTVTLLFCALVFFGIPLNTQSSGVVKDDNLVVTIVEQNSGIGQLIRVAVSEYFQGNLMNSYRDMFTRTNPHRHQLRWRYAAVSGAAKLGLETVILQPFSDPPKTVFVRDINSYPSGYNLGYALMHKGHPHIMPTIPSHSK